MNTKTFAPTSSKAKPFKLDYFNLGFILFVLWEIYFIIALLMTKPSNALRYSNEAEFQGFDLKGLLMLSPLVISAILVLIGHIKQWKRKPANSGMFYNSNRLI